MRLAEPKVLLRMQVLCEISLNEDYVEEACYYLSTLNVGRKELASSFGLDEKQVENAINSYKEKINSGSAKFEEDAKEFWARSYKESAGDERITLVDDKGRYYHGWKSELESLGSEQIVELLVVNKQYSDKHPLSEFSKGETIIGYDPLVPLRNIRRTVQFLEELLERKEPVPEDK
jgi:hypothetical protein